MGEYRALQDILGVARTTMEIYYYKGLYSVCKKIIM